MQHTIYGTFREGRVELDETPTDIHEARVEVRFLDDAPSASAEARTRALAAVEAVRRLALTDEEVKVLDELEDFRRAHPFSLHKLVKDQD